MKQIDCSNHFLPLIAKATGYHPSATAGSICCIEDGECIAGVIYDNYFISSVQCHIWVDEGKVPSREWIAAIFDYPFNHLKVKKIIGQVRADNEDALKLDTHFGFAEEARITDYFPDGESVLILSMTRDQCVILNSPKWAATVEKLKRGE